MIGIALSILFILTITVLNIISAEKELRKHDKKTVSLHES